MIQKKENAEQKAEKKGWFLYAALSAIFASLTAILGKLGIAEVESNLGTALRTGVVLLMAWVVVFAKGKGSSLREVPRNELGFICLSGIATGASGLARSMPSKPPSRANFSAAVLTRSGNGS